MTSLFATPTQSIVTLTLNPTIDTAFEADEVRPTQKTRTFNEHVDPGGGGINVARVLKRFGADVTALFLAGGHTGHLLDRLLGREAIEREGIEIDGDTRLSVTVFDRSSTCEYRFVPEGPKVLEREWRAALDRVRTIECDWLVASGSLPRGVPDDFYAQVRAAMPAGARFVLDTSGAALADALRQGGITLVKPNKAELEELAGGPLADREAMIAAASELVARGSADRVAVTLGHAGAILVGREGTDFVAAPAVESLSAVGAGDSFLAGLLYGLASGADRTAALRLGVAAGAASTLSPGTGLSSSEDVEKLYHTMS